MKRRRFLTVTVGVMVLSLGGCLGLTQNWDKNLPSASRFTVLAAFGGAAVRDNNTGLVWEQKPDTTTRNFFLALGHCINRIVPQPPALAGTAGWRLPSVVELKSVQDPSLPSPLVPASVFTDVQPDLYWSATSAFPKDIVDTAWQVNFVADTSGVGKVIAAVKVNSSYAWCVRGPMQEFLY